ncbi:MAG: C4-dicarboxylate ABC transporter, partial [Saccharolobus sp.]
MTCFKKFGYPIYFTMVMAIMAASIATYYYKIIILSSALMIIGIITLIFLSLVNVYTFSNISADPVDLMAVISGILAAIIRIKLFIPSLFYSSLLDVLLVIISIFWFIVLYLIIKNSSEDIYFKHHLIGVS